MMTHIDCGGGGPAAMRSVTWNGFFSTTADKKPEEEEKGQQRSATLFEIRNEKMLYKNSFEF